jgi:hypothetical protein
MKGLAPGRGISEYAVLYSFAVATVLVVWSQTPHAPPINWWQVVGKGLLISVLPMILSRIYAAWSGRVLLAMCILAYVQHELLIFH